MPAPIDTNLQTLRPLLAAEIDDVSGGMKWTRGTKNDDVIDARGGDITIFGVNFTFDKAGGISSVRWIGF